jgi:hypothetical protein
MRKLLPPALLLLLAPIAVYGQTCRGSESLSRHIYSPDRLVPTDKGCITVTGTVLAKIPEKDGDFHYRLKLDRGQGRGLVNAKNRTKKQRRFLVFEPICVGKVTQKSAKPFCRKFRQKITLPNKGDRVSVTGIHVLDTKHGWLELHPVTSIIVLH